MRSARVCYLMSGQPHLPYLTVSLWTLRQHYNGPVTVAAWPESIDLLRQIAQDKRLDIAVQVRRPAIRGKNDQFMDKIAMAMDQDGPMIYLDADTSIHAPIQPIFDRLEKFDFVSTQFCDWETSSPMIANRIQGLAEFEGIPSQLVEDFLLRSWPSVNGGVWGALPDSPILPHWLAYTEAAKRTFIADEKVLHLMLGVYAPSGKMTVMTDRGRWNCSPKYQPADLADEDVAIYHYHGDCNVRPKKCVRGLSIWWPMYQECIENNVGGIQDWHTTVNNKWIRVIEKEIVEQEHQQCNGEG